MANNLLSIRTNIFYTKTEEGEYIKENEIILLCGEAKYRLSNEGEPIREQGIKQFRFNIRNKNIQSLIDYLTELKDVDESDLGEQKIKQQEH